MKVAMLTTTGERCGIASYSRALVKALAEVAEVDVEPIEEGRHSAEYHREQADRLNRADVVHIQHEYSFWGSFMPHESSFPTLRNMITKPLVVTAHTTLSLAEMMHVKECHRLLSRIYMESLLLRRGFRKSVELAPFATQSECIVHTVAGRKTLIARGAEPGRVHIVPAGVPEPLHAPDCGAAVLKRLGLLGRRIISIFGYISWNKGYELTLQILPELPPDVVLVIAGGPRISADEPHARGLEHRIREMGLDNRAVITGYLSEEDIAGIMAASEIVLVPHTVVTGSYSVTIPLSYGRPVIASDQNCFREIYERVPCLQLFRSGDAQHFASRLKELLNDTCKRVELSQRARLYAEQYSWPEIARRTTAIYRKALCEGRPGHDKS